MTIAEYVREAMETLENEGMTINRIMKEVMRDSDQRHVFAMKRGKAEPSLALLKRLEAATGLSLDEVDRRIHRGEALASDLERMAKEESWSGACLGAALGVSKDTAWSIQERGRLGPYAKATLAIKLCDVMEGRLEVPTSQQLLRRKKASETALEAKFLSLPPEAQGDADYLKARRAFMRFAGNNPRLFRLRKAAPDAEEAAEPGESLFVADGPAISYQLRVRGDTVRVRAWVRRSGAMLTEREMWV